MRRQCTVLARAPDGSITSKRGWLDPSCSQGTAKASSERSSQDRAAVLFPADFVILVQETRITGNSKTVPGTEILNTYKLTQLGRHCSGPGQIAFIEWGIVRAPSTAQRTL